MNTVILGAGAGLGRALAERCAAAGHDVLLAGGAPEDLRAGCDHLRTVYGIRAVAEPVRVGGGDEWLNTLLSRAADFGGTDVLLLPVGAVMEDDDGTLSAADVRRLAEVNYLAPAALASAVLPGMLATGSGTIVGFGSVGAVRGRRSHVGYAAAKRALASYFESLRHRTYGTGVTVQFHSLGYLDTGNTYGKRLPFPAMAPDEAARRVVQALGRGGFSTCLPWYWKYVGWAVRATPWVVYRKLDF